jgi:plasmid stability protein
MWGRTCDGSVDKKLASSENKGMKTTLDLPEDLVRAVELRARREGRKLNDAVADLLREALAASTAPQPQWTVHAVARIETDPTTGLPVIQGDPDAPASQMTTAEMLALYRDSQLQEDLERLGLSP